MTHVPANNEGSEKNRDDCSATDAPTTGGVFQSMWAAISPRKSRNTPDASTEETEPRVAESHTTSPTPMEAEGSDAGSQTTGVIQSVLAAISPLKSRDTPDASIDDTETQATHDHTTSPTPMEIGGSDGGSDKGIDGVLATIKKKLQDAGRPQEEQDLCLQKCRDAFASIEEYHKKNGVEVEEDRQNRSVLEAYMPNLSDPSLPTGASSGSTENENDGESSSTPTADEPNALPDCENKEIAAILKNIKKRLKSDKVPIESQSKLLMQARDFFAHLFEVNGRAFRKPEVKLEDQLINYLSNNQKALFTTAAVSRWEKGATKLREIEKRLLNLDQKYSPRMAFARSWSEHLFHFYQKPHSKKFNILFQLFKLTFVRTWV